MPSSATKSLPVSRAELGRHAGYFALTAFSVWLTSMVSQPGVIERGKAASQQGIGAALASALTEGEALGNSLAFTAALLGILLAHEFGHYFAARAHRVDASLPFFIPMPLLSPFGTMGAVIRMREPIGTRRALLDIGAYGPLAGLLLAIPLYAYGAAHSHPVTLAGDGDGVILGESLLLKLLDWAFAPPVPLGQELMLSPVAFAAWGGMFVTMINLLPVGQLDAGHVAYALLGPRQNQLARWFHRGLLGVFLSSVVWGLFSDGAAANLTVAERFDRLGLHLSDNLFWLLWYHVLGVLGALSHRDGDPGEVRIGTRVAIAVGLLIGSSFLRDEGLWVALVWSLLAVVASVYLWVRNHPALFDHPPAEGELDLPRAVVAVCTLAFFVLLFMPRPISL